MESDSGSGTHHARREAASRALPTCASSEVVPISLQSLGVLFPAFLAVDAGGLVTAIGPSLRRHAEWLQPGDNLFAHFRSQSGGPTPDLADLAAHSGTVLLSAVDYDLTLTGAVLAAPFGYVLALNHVPAANTPLKLDASDFGPGDPQLSNLLLIRVQNALIAESRDVAAELTQERQRVVDVIERVGRMSGYLAHDLNNFLSVISLNAKRLLRTETRDERLRHYANVIIETADRCSDFTQGMMTLANQKNDSRLPFAIDTAIREAAALFRSACGSKITLRLDLDSGDAIVNAAGNGLVNSIINLLINSRQAMPVGGAITLSTRRCLPDQNYRTRAKTAGEHVVIAIADEGTGMSPEVLARAFELFFSTKESGTGVGLASVRDFAEQMDGWVTIESTEGQGTVARIFLPFAAEDLQQKPVRSLPLSEKSAGRRRVLVVDDEDYALEALAEFLEDEDYEVTTAGSAAEARACLENNSHDILVTDVIMQGTDGIDLARWANERQPDLPVILMSGFVPDADKLSSDWLFIRKPIDPDLLCRMIASVTGE